MSDLHSDEADWPTSARFVGLGSYAPETSMADACQSCGSSAVSLVAAIRQKELRSVNLTRAFVDRIHEYDGNIHCITHLDRDATLRQAERADQLTDADEPLGVLHGLPMTVKDGFRIAGMRSTFGLPNLAYHRPKADCEVIARLRRAGVVFLGRTSVPFAQFDWQCKPPFRRECLNPLDQTRTPGGSSGGAAAALAAGFTPLELGTDVAGSLRYPAHCCGVYALRTTLGWIPGGDIGFDHRPIMPSALAVGPMARSLEDLELLLSALAPEIDPRERVPAPRDRLRIAVTPSIPGNPVGGETAKAIAEVVRLATEAGHEIVQTEAPFDFDEAYSLWGLLGGYELRQTLPFGMRNRLGVRAFSSWFLFGRLGDGPLSVSLRAGMRASESEYQDGLAHRDELVEKMDRFLETHPFWVLPTSPGPAIPRQRSGKPITFESRTTSYSAFLGGYLCPTIPMSTPAAVVPITPTDGGMPIGVQIHARRFTDRWLIRTLREWLPDSIAK